MKKFIYQRKFAILTLLLFVFFSCDNNDEPDVTIENDTMPNIVEAADDTDVLSSLVAALKKADEREGTDLIGTLSGNGPFTVFAPTNDAFSALLEGLEGFDSLEDFDTDAEKELLAKILTYHVVSGVEALSTSLSNDQMIETVQGEEVTISLAGGVFIQDATEAAAQVTTADVETSNGVVHIIDKVLIPQAVLDALAAGLDSNTLVDVVVATDALSILKDAVLKADLADTLSSEGPFTVFAPTNDAFVALLEVLGDDYNSLDDFDTEVEIALLKNILLYHVLPAKVLAADLAPGTVDTALMDNSVEVIASGDTFVIGDASNVDANITATDIMASNGVAHTIDKVLLPQSAIDFVNGLNIKTIVDIAIATDDLGLLVGALQQADAGLVEALSATGPFTVFAPTNAAFVALLDVLGDDFNSLADFDTAEEKALLVKVLTYHVVAGPPAFAANLSNGQMIKTLQGEKVGINIKDNTVHIEDATDMNATVVMTDVEASNGVVHVIDKVLLPQEVLDALAPSIPNIVALAQSVPDLSLLVDALIQADAGLVGVLSGNGPFTVFAPTNADFADLLELLGDDYNSLADFDTEAEKALLAKVLTFHVANGRIESGDLTNGQEIKTLQGEALVAITAHEIRVFDKTGEGAEIIGPDNDASNGIVHIIDKVVLPQEVLDILNH